MEITDAEDLAHELLRANGCADVSFKWTRSAVEFGVVSYVKGSTRPTKRIRHNDHVLVVDAPMYRINHMGLSAPLVEANDRETVENVIRHELAHVLDVKLRGYTCHDEFWQELARSLGSDGVRCFDPFTVKPAVTVRYRKFVAVCPTCAHETFAHVRWPRARVCTRCMAIHPGVPERYRLHQRSNELDPEVEAARLVARRAAKAEASRRCRSKQR